jgi:hypothetical protein
MLKKLAQLFGFARGDLDKIVGKFSSYIAQLEDHADRANADATWHTEQAHVHFDLAGDATDEAKRAITIAGNIRKLVAA